MGQDEELLKHFCRHNKSQHTEDISSVSMKFYKMEEFFEKEDHSAHLDDSHLSQLEFDAKAYMRLLGAKSKDLVNQKNLDDYHEILDQCTVLDILDSKYLVVV